MPQQRYKQHFCILFACVFCLALSFLKGNDPAAFLPDGNVVASSLRKTPDPLSSEQLLVAMDAKIASLKTDVNAMMDEKLTASNARNDKQMETKIETAVLRIETKIETAVLAKATEEPPAGGGTVTGPASGGGTTATGPASREEGSVIEAKSVTERGEADQAAFGRNMSVVLRTWWRDAPIAAPGLESVIRFVGDQLLEIVVVTDEESAETVRTGLVEKLMEKYPELHQRDGIRLHVEPMFLENGHIQQKYSKMTADTYTKGDLIFHIDSDCVLIQWKSECYLEEGKPVNDYATFESLDKIVEIWKNGTSTVLGIPEELYEFSRLNQHVYPKQLYSILRRRVEDVHGMPFAEVFEKLKLVGKHEHWFQDQSTVLVSDFNLLGATSFHFAPDLMFQKNMTNGASSWRPICVSQCNVRVLGNECCETWLNEQIALADRGGIPKAHISCNPGDFQPTHPCFCG